MPFGNIDSGLPSFACSPISFQVRALCVKFSESGQNGPRYKLETALHPKVSENEFKRFVHYLTTLISYQQSNTSTVLFSTRQVTRILLFSISNNLHLQRYKTKITLTLEQKKCICIRSNVKFYHFCRI